MIILEFGCRRQKTFVFDTLLNWTKNIFHESDPIWGFLCYKCVISCEWIQCDLSDGFHVLMRLTLNLYFYFCYRRFVMQKKLDWSVMIDNTKWIFQAIYLVCVYIVRMKYYIMLLWMWTVTGPWHDDLSRLQYCHWPGWQELETVWWNVVTECRVFQTRKNLLHCISVM